MRSHRFTILSVLAAVPLRGTAKPLSSRWDDLRTKHSWNTVPKNWEGLGYPPPGTIMDLYIALKPHHSNALIHALNEVSSPGHPKYRVHLSMEQVTELVAPHPNTLEFVNSWLEHHGVPSSSISMTHGGNTLMLKGFPVNQANALLGASYQLYKHIESSETIIRTIGYAIPAALHTHVLTVAPTTSFVSPPRKPQILRNRSGGEAAELVKSASGEPSATTLSSRDDANYITPSFLHWLYDTYSYASAAEDQNMLGIVGYLGDYPSLEDMTAFMRKYRSDATDVTFTVAKVNGGGYDSSHPHQEANVDTQYAGAMAYPTPLIFYSTGLGRSDTDDWYISWFHYILRQRKVPQTISMSYGLDEEFISREYAEFVCEQFAKLGLRGVSVVLASGDEGVGKGSCRGATNDGTTQFIPHFPATCPWVTAVGGTVSYEPEVGAEFSGGGFSNYFKRPDYQAKAVSNFFQGFGNRHKGLYNDTGRGIPDIATQANRFTIFFNGIEHLVGGTSCAAPVAAGIISLLNDYLLSKGEAPLGFLNPWLYGIGSDGLTDITRGSNPGCDTDGFSAIDGWDPVSGLGTPSFAALQEILSSMIKQRLSSPTKELQRQTSRPVAHS